jgi:methionyl-tRNA synthetase
MHRKELETGRARIQLATENTSRMKQTLESAHIQIDHWLEPFGNSYFEGAAREVYDSALRGEAIIRRTSEEPFCPACRTWGYEAFGRGRCNYCGSDSDASQCEKCAFPPDAALMKSFACKMCSGPFEWRPVERQVLLVGRYESYLRNLYRQAPIRPPMQEWTVRVLATGPKGWPITRPDEAGLDLMQDGSCRLHTWFLGLAGYMATLREYADVVAGKPELYAQFWSSPGAKLVHFLGYDCAYSHMVVYPILLSHLERAPTQLQFYPNQFLKLDGLNLSTSRNHAIWIRDLVSDYAPDAVRLYLASLAPETGEGDFQVNAFKRWYQEVFLDELGALLQRARNEKRETLPGEDDEAAEALLLSVQERWRTAASIETFSMRALAHLVFDLISIGQQRRLNGAPVGPVVDMIRTFGGALLPDLAERYDVECGLTVSPAPIAARYMATGSGAE